VVVNLFDSAGGQAPGGEHVDILLRSGDVTVERIVSSGHASPPGSWYDQDWDEWVAVVQGRGVLSFDDGTLTSLAEGESAFLPAHKRHRVQSTSADPPCIWLAVHIGRPRQDSISSP
jgi:cupin 2 domain-containing protein